MEDYELCPWQSIFATAADPIFYPSPPSTPIFATAVDPPAEYEYPSFYSPPPTPAMYANGFSPAALGYSDYGFFDEMPQAAQPSFHAPPPPPPPPPRAEAGCFEPWPLAPKQSIAADEILYGRGPRSRPRLPVFEAICPTPMEPCRHQLSSSLSPPSAGCCEIASVADDEKDADSSKHMTSVR
jgi:hypothetical protein